MSIEPSMCESTGFSFTGRIAGWSARRRWPVLGATVAVLVVSFLLSNSLGITTSEISGAGDARHAQDLVDERFDVKTPRAEVIVFSNPNLDMSDQDFRGVVDSLVEELRSLDGVDKVVSFYDTGQDFMVSGNNHVIMARLEFEPAESSELRDISSSSLTQ